jgi:hypothetical protein
MGGVSEVGLRLVESLGNDIHAAPRGLTQTEVMITMMIIIIIIITITMIRSLHPCTNG